MKRFRTALALLIGLMCSMQLQAKRYEVIAYYTGDAARLQQYPLEKIDQLIFSFLHLKENKLAFNNEQHKKKLEEIVAFKKKYPHLKILISLGGWTGCYTCSPVFAKAENREVFAQSVLDILKETNTDGIDLDWEYPTIPGPPGHPFSPDDKSNFSELIKTLRKKLGKKFEISFAAGGFEKYIQEAVDWQTVTPLVNRINLMTYDLINGYSTSTGHHTALYSRPEQKESTDHCVQLLLQQGVPANKLIIGAAFYSRMWKEVAPVKNGLYQAGIHTGGVSYSGFANKLTPSQGFTAYWDDTAKAMHYYNPEQKLFATMDDPRSIREKVAYMKKLRLGGIMFWELSDDKPANGLLSVIHETIHQK